MNADWRWFSFGGEMSYILMKRKDVPEQIKSKKERPSKLSTESGRSRLCTERVFCTEHGVSWEIRLDRQAESDNEGR
jgi:hypothetical protein